MKMMNQTIATCVSVAMKRLKVIGKIIIGGEYKKKVKRVNPNSWLL